MKWITTLFEKEKNEENPKKEKELTKEDIENIIDILASENIYDDISDFSDVDLSKKDPLFEEAARLLVAHQIGSTALIQRKFSIGYNRAKRIVDQLEAAGVVGPSFDDNKTRQVLILDEYHLEQLFSNMIIPATISQKQIEEIREQYSVEIEKRQEELEHQIALRKLEEEKQQVRDDLLEEERKRLLKRTVKKELIESGQIQREEERTPIPNDLQDRVWVRDGGKCVLCGSNENLEFDHIIPVSKGGAATYRNIQLLCQKCNRSKSNNIGNSAAAETIDVSSNTDRSNLTNTLVSNKKYKDFQEKYGAIPASDKDSHIIKCRMLQGIYRNQNIENAYCNYVFENSSFVNFMRNEQLKSDAEKELASIKQRERLTNEKRLLENLLSSQPMAFNIFLPLKWHNFEVGNIVFKDLFPFLNIKHLVDIKMEYVPGDGIGKDDRKITTDNSCFDVYIEYKNTKDEFGGIGIEVKYTEPFSQSDYWKETGYKKDRYIEAIQKYSFQFYKEYEREYLQPTYNQLFRNQLLAEEVKDKFNMNCILAVVYSQEDVNCVHVVTKFRDLIKLENSCIPVSISQIVQSVIKASDGFSEMKTLYNDIYNRYSNYELLDKFLKDK